MAILVNKIHRVLAYLLLVVVLSKPLAANASSQVPCFFIFGDSLIDSGNNNQLDTKARANYKPYGIDFPKGLPTGRFTNGRTVADFLAQFMGFEDFIPPYANATAQGQEIIKVVNYGSGSAGIRDETGHHLGDRTSLKKQLGNHNVSIGRIRELIGDDSSTREHLGKCLYLLVIGSNDYINNYYMPEHYTSSHTYTPTQYATLLTQQYSHHLKTLYSYGARKLAVTGLGPIGCIPFELARNPQTKSLCVDSINDAVKLFNDKLKLLVDDLNKNLTDAEFAYISSMTGSPTEAFAIAGLVLGEPCCKVSSDIGQCIPEQTPCLLRDLHMFYDDFHPTEIMNKIAATGAYVDIRKLIS